MVKKTYDIPVKSLDLKKIAESGQCFRMDAADDGRWLVIALDMYCYASQSEAQLTIEAGHSYDFEFWENYFDLQSDYNKYNAAIDPDDAFLCAAAKASEGIRILRQDPWEMLISFIISQRKNIPAIKSSIKALCEKFGEPITEDRSLYSFPTPDELIAADPEELSKCGLGYRVPYIIRTAQFVEELGTDFMSFNDLDDDKLLQELMKFHGVGVKVANCVSLFGFHRISAFPIDVWINRVLCEHYPNGFPFERYEGFAGVLQQYMFYYARTNG